MREGKYLQLGALALGVGLSLGVAAPALAEDLEVALTPDGTQAAVSSTEQARVDAVVEVDPQVAFTAAYLACIDDGNSISDCTEAVLEGVGLEDEEFDTVDNTPFNPVDEGSVEDVPIGPVIGVLPPGV